MNYGGNPGWNPNFAPGPGPYQQGFSQPQQHQRGGFNSNRRGGYRSPPNHRTEPYNRGGHAQRGNGPPRAHHQHNRRNDQPKDISAFVKPSFFENPWRYLEPTPTKSEPISTEQVAPPAPSEAVSDSSPASSSTNTISSPALSKIGLSLPPPKQGNTGLSSKFSDFLSKLPPPKSGDPSQSSDV